jgi:hypothetical protein
MAWGSTFIGKGKIGDKWITYGTWDGSSVTGGDIDTRLRVCDACFLTHTGSAAEAATATINETFPGIGGTTVTVVCSSNDAGEWMAIGRE